MAELKTISQFKSKLRGGGSRANLFEVEIPSFPAAALDLTDWGSGSDQEQDKFRFLCKAAQLPASNVAAIDVPFRGRILKVAGDRTFDTWTVTIINDEDFRLRTSFEQWMNAMSSLTTNTGATDPGSYMADAYVHQLGRGLEKLRSTATPDVEQGEIFAPLRSYKFFDIFPTNVSAIDLSYDTSDEIEEFTVEFQVQYSNALATDQTGESIN